MVVAIKDYGAVGDGKRLTLKPFRKRLRIVRQAEAAE